MSYALVTGASRGIGSAIAKRIAKEHGYKIIVNYNSNEAAAIESLSKLIEAGTVIKGLNLPEEKQ